MSNDTFADFDFGLGAAEEERAARLHAESIVIDVLFQGPVGYRAYTADLLDGIRAAREKDGPGAGYFAAVSGPIREAVAGRSKEFQDTWEASGITGGNRQSGFDDEHWASWALNQLQFDAFPWLIKATRADDFRRAKAEGKRAGYVSTQNTTGLDRKLQRLQTAHDLGMRMVGLTYNEQNAVGGGCTERTDTGVSNFGAAVIARMNELGMIVDTAHSGRQTTLDACELSEAPVVASHTSADAVVAHDRAKTDEELHAIAETGGVIGIVAVPFFLGVGEGVTIEAMLDHIDHVAQTVGWQHVAIGTDWPLQADKETLDAVLIPMTSEMGFRDEHNIQPTANLVGFDDYRDFPNITRGLVGRGYTDEQIAGILGGNYLRVFEAVCG